MPLSQLDSSAALIVIDLQKGIVSRATAHPTGEIVRRCAQLARAFRERGLPVVLVHVTAGPKGRTATERPKVQMPPDWAELVPELDRQAGDHVVTKQHFGAFIGTDLHEYLQERGVTQIFMTGVATSIGVESTARSAFDYDYNVVFIEDEMTDRDGDAHRYCVEKIFPRLGEIETTENVVKTVRGLGGGVRDGAEGLSGAAQDEQGGSPVRGES